MRNQLVSGPQEKSPEAQASAPVIFPNKAGKQ